jgi:hypothetical protein
LEYKECVSLKGHEEVSKSKGDFNDLDADDMPSFEIQKSGLNSI